MRASPLLDAPTAGALGFSWLARALQPAGEHGERVFQELRPFFPGQERAAQSRAAEIASIAASADAATLDAIRQALRTVPDVAGTIAQAAMGEVLTDAQFLELQRFCDGAAAVDVLTRELPALDGVAGPGLKALRRELEPGRVHQTSFYLSDAFDPRLLPARSQADRAQAELDAARGRAAAAVASAVRRDDVSTGEFIVMRADLEEGRLPAGVRVLREAPTYFLCTLDYDDATLAALERRDASAAAVADAEEAVRTALSSIVARNASGLHAAGAALGRVDVTIAAARFARRHGGCVAEIVAQPSLSFRGGRFLPLAEALEAQGRSFAPIDVDLRDAAVLTGPNMGGKSVCLRTCGLIACCAAFGLPVPASTARTSLFDEIAWLGIGSEDGQPGGLLSSFAKEVVRLRDILDRMTPRFLVLIDEFARTTTPLEGKALMLALLERLSRKGIPSLAATHLAGVAQEAGVRHFAVRGLRGIPERPRAADLDGALRVLAESMDYTIVEVTGEGETGADAVALAALLGLDAELVADAYRHLNGPSAPDSRPQE